MTAASAATPPRNSVPRSSASHSRAARARAAAPRTAGTAAITTLDYYEARPAAVVLLSGPEEFLAHRASGTIRDILRAAHPALEIHDVDAATYSAGQLFTLASPSLFAEPRLIRIAAVDKANDALLQDVTRYLAQTAEDTTLVLHHAGGQRGKNMLNAVRGQAGAAIGAIEVTCTELKNDASQLNFAHREFRRLNAQITPSALRTLVTAYPRAAELASTIEQLVTDVGRRITEQDVEQATAGRAEVGAFKVADAAAAARPKDALVLLRQALGSGVDAVPMLAALGLKVRNMARVYGSEESSASLARAFGVAPWQIERAKREVRGWKEKDLVHAVDLIAATELAVKGGTQDPLYALERCVLVIAGRGSLPGS